MSRVAHIIWSCVGIVIALALMTLAVVWGYMSRPTDVPCAGLRYDIEDAEERMYLTENELTALLRSNDIYPVGRKLNIISLHRIEKTIAHHPMVRTAECFLTTRHEVVIRLTQRQPILRVETPVDVYFIDSDRRVMQARASVRDVVLVATGTVGVQMASGPLADFAEWIADEDYWQERIHHVYVSSPQMVYLYLRDSQQPRVVMGNLRNYDKKLNKLRTFFLNTTAAMKDKNYTELDVRFHGQVIGRY